MNKKLSAPAASVAYGKVPAPVRVRLKRVNCNEAIPYPPDGQAREWWHRLQSALHSIMRRRALCVEVDACRAITMTFIA